uniref:AT-rich interactive domain-containing protein 5B n=1 Tax=Sphaerodactylus townsendi TaxID=933632 RepID=A0ACB8F9G7_9SAUR
MDEVIAASEKVTVKLEDLAKWAQADCSKWKRGLRVEALRPAELGKNGQKEALTRFRQSTHNSGLNFKDILKEKADLGDV